MKSIYQQLAEYYFLKSLDKCNTVPVPETRYISISEFHEALFSGKTSIT